MIVEFLDTALDHLWALVAGLAGRLLFHSREAQAGRRRFWGRELPFELLIAISMGMIGSALATYFNLSGEPAAGLVSALAYLGPRAIDTLFERATQAAGSLLSGKSKP